MIDILYNFEYFLHLLFALNIIEISIFFPPCSVIRIEIQIKPKKIDEKYSNTASSIQIFRTSSVEYSVNIPLDPDFCFVFHQHVTPPFPKDK